MLETTSVIEQCYQLLAKTNSNVVWEILRQADDFHHWKHYPLGDVFDKETKSQYYYHAHTNQTEQRWEEHGHFHLFIRQTGIPEKYQPKVLTPLQQGVKTDSLCHLCAISMDKFGKPIRLFTTNRWVTGETWYTAHDVIALLPRFAITHAWPSWPTNIWLTQLIQEYREQINQLLLERDRMVDEWQLQFPEKNVFENRALEITSSLIL